MCSFLGFWKCAETNAASVASSVVDSFHESSRADEQSQPNFFVKAKPIKLLCVSATF
jgi:hypothetical protein